MVISPKGIRITAKADGKVTIEAVGFSGPTCAIELGALQDILSMSGGEEKLKPEFFEARQELHNSQGN